MSLVASFNKTLQGPFEKSPSAKKAAIDGFQTSYGVRASPNLIDDNDYESIRENMSTSPKAIKPTSQRLDYLLRAKKVRAEKKMRVTGR